LIKNKNLVFGKATASSPATDRYFQLPKIALASLPTASSANEGGIAYDTTNDKVVFSTGTRWGNVADVGPSKSPSLSPSLSPSTSPSTSPSVSVSPSVSPS
jgi:hypothetical protein